MTDRTAASGAASESAKPSDADLRAALREVRELMHDIRNHLHGTLGLVSLLLLQSSEPLSGRLRPLIEAQAEQLMHLIDKLPADGRGATAKPSATPFVAVRFVPALLDLYRPYAAEHGMRLAHYIGEGTAAVATDTKSLHRLLSNLLVNAIKHSQAAKVTLFVEPLPHAPGVRFVIADDGIGIPPPALMAMRAVLNGLHVPSSAYDRSGLVICAGIAARLGATLSLQSDGGDGTTVTVDLPMRGDEAGVSTGVVS